nr:MAG TPA: hypothetical protein [Caudoviricetes sp.]
MTKLIFSNIIIKSKGTHYMHRIKTERWTPAKMIPPLP